MCGISVLLAPHASPKLISRLVAMHGVIRHRGPDGEGFLLSDGQGKVIHATKPDTLIAATTAPRVGFAFRRLKICDLSEAADQPMGSADQKIWVVFNGEIYNFRELRAELEGLGHAFRTHGDTEVVLAAYQQWGEGLFRPSRRHVGPGHSRSAAQSPGGVARPLRHQAGVLEDRS